MSRPTVKSSEQAEPADALRKLAAWLLKDGSVISPYVIEPRDEPALGLVVAAGPRTCEAPTEYALVIEAVREGYLLHYGTPRLLAHLRTVRESGAHFDHGFADRREPRRCPMREGLAVEHQAGLVGAQSPAAATGEQQPRDQRHQVEDVGSRR